jgi:anti-anti-sigma regulatory factor
MQAEGQEEHLKSGGTIRMFFNYEQYNGFGVLRLFGGFTSRNAAKLKKAFFIGFTNSEHLIMDFKGISEVDDFFAEQVLSLKKISGKAKKKLTIINSYHIQTTLGDPCPYL